MKTTPQKIGVVITTYNSPQWLALVLAGYENQQWRNFNVLIADDGSDHRTEQLIKDFQRRKRLLIKHYWQPDEGFQKTRILNKVIAETDCDYLIFTDGDCIPRADFVATHRARATKNCFLSGGYVKLTKDVSEKISAALIQQQKIFTRAELLKLGQPASLKLMKLIGSPWLCALLNRLTPTKASWNGMNSSGWRDDLVKVNGYDERMQYGGLDRELGERLINAGLRGRQIRYSAVCLHLDHPRGYATPASWQKNKQIRRIVAEQQLAWTPFGIVKDVP